MIFEIKKPDDWHLHLRDGKMLENVVFPSAFAFCRVGVMPNLSIPIKTVEQALIYRNQIKDALQKNLANKKQVLDEPSYCLVEKSVKSFSPCMLLFLSDDMTKKEVEKAATTEEILGIKLYPQNATTNAKSGVKDISALYPIIEWMQEKSLPLLIHGESGDSQIDVFDRENVFIDRELDPLLKRFPNLKVTLEHISTKYAVDYVREKSASHDLAATITVHHLLIDRNDLLSDGIRPHYYCKPIVKRSIDKEALIAAAISANSCFFLGTDSAPHPKNAKESCCGAAGVFSAPNALPLLVSLFEKKGTLNDKSLENFCSVNGAKHYGFPVTKEIIALQPVEPAEPVENNFQGDNPQENNSAPRSNSASRSKEDFYKNSFFESSSSVEVFSAFPGRIWEIIAR